MILGLGTDLVEIARIESGNDRLPQRILTADEREEYARRDPARRAAFLASRFAAKEACAKALGTGIGETVSFQDICIQKDALGKPHLILSGGALARLNQLLPQGHAPALHVSLTDTRTHAQALVVLEANPASGQP